MQPSSVKITRSPFAKYWGIDPDIDYLNHGAFGACPLPVLDYCRKMTDLLENDPWRFQVIDLPKFQYQSRKAVAEFIHADVEDIVFVPNVTHGVSTVLRSLNFKPGDELLTTNMDYFACRNAIQITAQRSGARLVVVPLPFPIKHAGEVVEAILSHVSTKTKLALIDHVTSPTALILPVKEIVAELNARGIDVLVDGAHAPGMVPLNLSSLGAAYYTGNCHKWMCAPKSAGFLYVRRDKQRDIHPLAISHVASEWHPETSDFQHEFFWAGTLDQAAYVSVGEAIRFMASLMAGGWEELMSHNHHLALEARRLLCETLAIDVPCPDDMIGSMAAIPLPAGKDYPDPIPAYYVDPLQEALFRHYRIDVPVHFWPQAPNRMLRISAQLYNDILQYQRLAEALQELITR